MSQKTTARRGAAHVALLHQRLEEKLENVAANMASEAESLNMQLNVQLDVLRAHDSRRIQKQPVAEEERGRAASEIVIS